MHMDDDFVFFFNFKLTLIYVSLAKTQHGVCATDPFQPIFQLLYGCMRDSMALHIESIGQISQLNRQIIFYLHIQKQTHTYIRALTHMNYSTALRRLRCAVDAPYQKLD